jgi:crotonobetainyl-CoA:carnitine CoA-transferase CaiB-like acyl-CoA transferase
MRDEQAWANQYIMKAYSEEVQREVEIRGLPLTLSKTPTEVRVLGPQLGQDTETLMLDLLGYEWAAIEEMKAKEVIL